MVLAHDMYLRDIVITMWIFDNYFCAFTKLHVQNMDIYFIEKNGIRRKVTAYDSYFNDGNL